MTHPSIRHAVLAFLLLLGALLGACLDTSPTPAPTSSTEQALVGQRCGGDCDCPFGNYCSGGICEPDFAPLDQCYCSARDCGAGQACTSGVCTAQPTTCRTTCDCAFGNVCSAGICEPDFGPLDQCYCSARDCDGGQVCSAGACRDRIRPR